MKLSKSATNIYPWFLFLHRILAKAELMDDTSWKAATLITIELLTGNSWRRFRPIILSTQAYSDLLPAKAPNGLFLPSFAPSWHWIWKRTASSAPFIMLESQEEESQARYVDEFKQEQVDNPANPTISFISMWRSIFKKYKHHHVC